MKVLGIHDGHNASACLQEDGIVKAVLQEERLNRVKNWSGFPAKSIEKVLALSGCDKASVDIVAFNGHHMPRPKGRDEIMDEYRQTSSLTATIKRALKKTALRSFYRQMRKTERLRELEKSGIPASKAVFVDHHLAHAAAAYHGMGEKSSPVLVLTNDGAGDGLCATVSIGKSGRLDRLAEVPESESVANLYAMVTFIMGMVPLEHEYKLMGMAPYAPHRGTEVVREKFAKLIEFRKSAPLAWSRSGHCPPTYYSYEFLSEMLQLCRFDWICAGLQKFTEDFLVRWVSNCVRETGMGDVALSGGIFMNVKANKLISELPGVKRLFIFPSCGDESNSIGAAYQAHADACASRGNSARIEPLGPLYLGTDHPDEEIGEALSAQKGITFERHGDISAKAAGLLAAGEIVARMSGRSEFGARALGNRSIMADASRTDVVRVINDMIKSRDFWMPFAPSILAEKSSRYIINPKRVRSPYMMMSFDTTDERSDIKAAIHPYDFTARPHEVDREWNPSYHGLIERYEKLTGRSGILNTSFNLHGFPIVESPADALDVLMNSGLKRLVIGDFLVTKKTS